MRRITRGFIGLTAALLLSGCTSGPVIDGPDPEPEPEWEVTQPADPLPIEQLAAFSGVVMLDAGSNCTGTLIDTGVSDSPTWVLTNGHCTGDLSRFDQKTTLATEWAGEAQFLRAAGRTESTLSRDVVEIAYSTMRFTDTAVVRLEGTLGELTELGIRAVPITDDEPNPGDAVVNIGVPVQHLDPEDWFLRRGECTLGDQHTLIELTWTWLGRGRTTAPASSKGSSGSPLLQLDRDGNPEAIVAVINTTTVGAERALGGPCFINQPCEFHDGVATLAADTSYAQSAAGIGRCFDAATGEFAVGGDCPLPVGDVWFESGGGTFRGGGLPDGVGRMPQVSAVGSEAGTMRAAVTPIGDAQACLRAETYTGAVEQPLPASGER